LSARANASCAALVVPPGAARAASRVGSSDICPGLCDRGPALAIAARGPSTSRWRSALLECEPQAGHHREQVGRESDDLVQSVRLRTRSAWSVQTAWWAASAGMDLAWPAADTCSPRSHAASSIIAERSCVPRWPGPDRAGARVQPSACGPPVRDSLAASTPLAPPPRASSSSVFGHARASRIASLRNGAPFLAVYPLCR